MDKPDNGYVKPGKVKSPKKYWTPLSDPNLFHFATKELSQDAMICWLIQWAGQGKGAGPEQEELSRCGRRFVLALLNHKRADTDPIQLEDEIKTEIHQQDRSIDVLARINDKHVLLVEDKTGTKDHGRQLERYYNEVIEGRTKLVGEVLEINLYPLYLKTGNQSLANDCRIEAIKNYKVFHRKYFLKVLDSYKGHNSILWDFRQHLRELEDQTNSYVEWTRDAGQESWRSWEGFYLYLERTLGNGTCRHIQWGYVPNPSGGFLGFWWWLKDNPDPELYLQIEAYPGEEARLCFKVDAEGKTSEQKQDLKWHWHERVKAAGGDKVMKPNRMVIGNWMTVAWWKDDWMAFKPDNKLDLPGTVKNLEQAEAVMKKAIPSKSQLRL